MNLDLLIALLKNTLNCSVNIRSLSNEIHIPISLVKKSVLSLAKNNIVTSNGKEEVKVSEGQRINLVIFTLKECADLERVCRALGWKEFEDLVALILEHNSYRVMKHFRFKGLSRRYEIDVIGVEEPFILSIECKHWKQSWRRAATIDAVKTQVERTKALVQHFPELKDRLGLARWKKTKCIPLVSTLSNTPIKVFDRVPVVPIFYLNNFLNEIQKHIDRMMMLYPSNML
jgi:Holliday junction resolvase-like predicted endonuclease